MNFPAYSKYKDSGVEWLGQVPDHWDVDRIKASVESARNGIWGEEADSEGLDIPCVRVADFDRGTLSVKLNDPTMRKVTEKERSGRVLLKGNLLLEKSGGGEGQPVGCVVLYDDEKPAVCSNFVARVELSDGMVSSFWRYVHAAAYSIRLTTCSINQTSGIQNLDQAAYFNERAAFPSEEEQKAIGKFLDHETTKIDALIHEQNRLVELLAEERHAVGSNSITKGLNPLAATKQTGVEWLGNVPSHWKIVALKRLATVQCGVAKGKDYMGKDTVKAPYLRVANVQDGYLDLEDVAEIEVGVEDVQRYQLRDGDVLMNEGGDFDKLGRGHIWREEIAGCIHQNHVFAVRPTLVSSEWLNAVTGSAYAQFYFMTRSKQSTNLASISSSNIMELPVLLPPEDEQREILLHIKRIQEKADLLAKEAEKAIALLKERRSALIAAAVTGKIDVREAA
ncbi:restriction endonuclease subunit S [Acidovorax soli]|uniref:Type I restriction enzyme, S subunit n=1 Tax=Acidovorax soli TaxID=592050 RepID=A0A1H4EZU0_9BURK|nr:restriction endonuclease subunit S [Acidovorax soli]SEA89812.1 type I restriction enzyme, S subunit [Acidovorax soli]